MKLLPKVLTDRQVTKPASNDILLVHHFAPTVTYRVNVKRRTRIDSVPTYQVIEYDI